ncbi:MAG TPA: 16S rRNA (guanine(527)-N(7))-methyltransferase RsmG [Candidatus Acidoferrum sp.]|nr:16S rRNA (guanine(527)-N(7))-methyltransferase RsmG [Candidatus Acidoferrum sp.]
MTASGGHLLTDDRIREALAPYGATPDATVCHAIRAYTDLLLRWNQRVSLTTVTSPEEILRFHFGESVFAASTVLIQNGRLADFGSGAGFPGLPLALFAPALDVSLIESNTKKAAFLLEVQRILQLHNVRVLRGRAEDLSSTEAGFDFVTARAIGRFRELLAWAAPRLNSNGNLVLWLGEDDARDVSKSSDWIWLPPTRIPGTERRSLLVGSRSSAGPKSR